MTQSVMWNKDKDEGDSSITRRESARRGLHLCAIEKIFCHKKIFCLFDWWLLGHEACGIPVPRSGPSLVAPAEEAQSLNPWTTREVLTGKIYVTYILPPKTQLATFPTADFWSLPSSIHPCVHPCGSIRVLIQNLFFGRANQGIRLAPPAVEAWSVNPWTTEGVPQTGLGCHCLLQCMKVKSESEVAQSCLTLRDPMDCSLPGSSIHGIFQARVLECGAIAFSGLS